MSTNKRHPPPGVWNMPIGVDVLVPIKFGLNLLLVLLSPSIPGPGVPYKLELNLISFVRFIFRVSSSSFFFSSTPIYTNLFSIVERFHTYPT